MRTARSASKRASTRNLALSLLVLVIACDDQFASPAAAPIRGQLVLHREVLPPGDTGESGVAVTRRYPPIVWLPSPAYVLVKVADKSSGPPYHIDFELPYVPSGEYFLGAISDFGEGSNKFEKASMRGVLGGMCAAGRGENKITVGTEPIENVVIHLWGDKGNLDPCFAEQAALLGDAGAGDASVEPRDPYEGFDEPCTVDQSPGAAPFTSTDCSDNAAYCVPWPLDELEGHCSSNGCFEDPGRCPAGWVCVDPAEGGVEGFDDVGGACVNPAWLGG